jgi:hypothetical protein
MTKNLVKKFLNEHLLENLLDEDYPTNWNAEEFSKLTSFAQRKQYSETHLKRISSGSGRIVYKIDDQKVLKLAKNTRGVAQTEVEIDLGKVSYFSHMLAEIFHYNKNNLWVEMELARKVTAAAFKKIAGVDIATFNAYLNNWDEERHNRRGIYHVSPEELEIINESEFCEDVRQFINDSSMGVGDLGKLSTWGLVTREGYETMILIDYGLTSDVYDTYYS